MTAEEYKESLASLLALNKDLTKTKRPDYSSDYFYHEGFEDALEIALDLLQDVKDTK